MIGVSAAAAGFVGLGLIGGLIETTGGGEQGPSASSPSPGPPGSDEPRDPKASDSPAEREKKQGKKSGTTRDHPAEERSESETKADEGPDRVKAKVTVQRIVDGDTIVVSSDGSVLPDRDTVRVRLLEMDTPETGKCFADEATARTSALLPIGSTVRVERDEDLRDRYGRYLLYVWNDEGRFVNLSLVNDGFAKAVLYQPNDKYWQRISGAEGSAEAARAGLWSGCDKPPPPREKVEPPEPAKPAKPELPDPDPPKPDPSRPEKPAAPAGPPAGGPDLDCSDFPGSVPVGPDDPHRLDRDGDGIGCD